jgi:hypothetical protein
LTCFVFSFWLSANLQRPQLHSPALDQLEQQPLRVLGGLGGVGELRDVCDEATAFDKSADLTKSHGDKPGPGLENTSGIGWFPGIEGKSFRYFLPAQ